MAELSTQTPAVFRLTEEPAGLLAGQGRYLEPIAVLRDLDLPGVAPPDHLVAQGQALQFPDGAVVAQQDGGRAQQLVQGGEQVGAGPLHARGGDLDHQQVGVTVHHQAGQAVAFAMDQAVEGLVIEPLAQVQGLAQPFVPQGRPQGPAGVLGHQPGADQGPGVDVAMPQGMAPMGEDLNRLTRLQALQGGRLGIDLVAVDPAVAGEEAAILIFVQAQGGGAGHRRDSWVEALACRKLSGGCSVHA